MIEPLVPVKWGSLFTIEIIFSPKFLKNKSQ